MPGRRIDEALFVREIAPQKRRLRNGISIPARQRTALHRLVIRERPTRAARLMKGPIKGHRRRRKIAARGPNMMLLQEPRDAYDERDRSDRPKHRPRAGEARAATRPG